MMNTEYSTQQRPHLTTSYNNNTFNTRTYYNNTSTNIKNNLKTKLKPLTPALPKNITDDCTFALTEIKELDKKIHKRNSQRQTIWKVQTDNNFYGAQAMKHHQDLQGIKEKVRLTGGWESFNLKREIHRKKYFPVEQVDILQASDNIKTEVNFRKQRHDKHQDLYTFATQNRQICLKNILIDLLKTERNTIASKENAVSAALTSANKTFLKDVKDFYTFTEVQKVAFHNIELKLAEKVRLNKELIEDKKSLTLEYRSIQDEIEKVIREIIQFKSYADFIHTVLGNGAPCKLLEVDFSHIDLLKKDRDLDKIIYEIKTSLNFLYEQDPNYKPAILQNPILLNNQFFQLEANIIKYLNIALDLKDHLHMLHEGNDAVILDLKTKENATIREREQLSHDTVDKQCYYDTEKKLEENMKLNSKLILEIYEELKDTELNMKQIKHKTANDLLKEIVTILEEKESLVDKYQQELTVIQNDYPKIFQDLVTETKNRNKKAKIKEGKEKMRLLEEAKNRKYQQRNRYKLNGQITFPPPGILKKNRKYEADKKKNNMEDYEILNY